jgi:putative ABC transport system permease protein
LKIVGIIRPNKDTMMGSLSSGIGYTEELYNYILQENLNSDIVNWMKEESNLTIDPFTGLPYTETATNYADLLRSIGGNGLANRINIYSVNFDAKTKIMEYLDNYTTVYPEETEIKYTDTAEIVISIMKTLIDAISYVLIAFTAISLIVSSVMIGIITYVSVVERTKEIGVLRSIGARKKDISRVFNAETFIIGLFSGFIGVITAVLLTIPINIIIASLVDNMGNLAILNIWHGVGLIVISICLTLIAGLIPSKIAANKDPVEALRNE